MFHSLCRVASPTAVRVHSFPLLVVLALKMTGGVDGHDGTSHEYFDTETNGIYVTYEPWSPLVAH